MDAGEVFLSCNNLTLEQYRIIILSRALTGAGGCAVSIAVLVIILLTTKRKAWENLTKRIYLANVLYTLLYSIVAIAAVNYSRPPSQESTWCGIMGFILHYSGTLVVVHYLALILTVAFQVILSVCQAVRKRSDSFRKAKLKLREIFLYLILFLCPLLNSWEPFLPQLPSYGNYGPLCWFRLELTDNCTYNTLNGRFLQAIPFAVVCFGYSVLTFTMLLILCGMYCKFRTTTIGGRIVSVIPTVIILIILPIVVMVKFIVSAVPTNAPGSFSAWLSNVTVTSVVTIGALTAAGIYVYLPTHLCEQCRRAPHLSTGQNEQNGHQLVHPPVHNKSSSQTSVSNLHATVTTDLDTALHLPKVDSCNHHSCTSYSIAHSPVTTETAPLIPHPPKVGPHNDLVTQSRTLPIHQLP